VGKRIYGFFAHVYQRIWSVKLSTVKTTTLLGIAVLLFVLELMTGPVKIPLSDVVQILFGKAEIDQAWKTIVLESRLPRALTAAIGGGALAISGLMMQTLFRNPLAGPDVLGVTSGASLGVALLMMASGGVSIIIPGLPAFMPVALAALAGAFVVLLLIILVSEKMPDNITLIIFGIMFSYFTSAIVSALQFKTSGESLRSFVFWGMGSFAETGFVEIAYLLVVLIVGLAITFFILPRLNLMLLGEDYAKSMGVNVKQTRLLIIVATGILAGIVTAFCGPVSFIGLAVPHIARMVMKTSNHERLILPVLMSGLVIGMFCDLLSRWLQLPLNTIASALGAPVVVYIIMKGTKTKAII